MTDNLKAALIGAAVEQAACERAGMEAENTYCQQRGTTIAFIVESFGGVAENLGKRVEEIMAAGTKQEAGCPDCDGPSGENDECPDWYLERDCSRCGGTCREEDVDAQNRCPACQKVAADTVATASDSPRHEDAEIARRFIMALGIKFSHFRHDQDLSKITLTVSREEYQQMFEAVTQAQVAKDKDDNDA